MTIEALKCIFEAKSLELLIKRDLIISIIYSLEVSKMEIQLALFLTFVGGAIISSWMIVVTSRSVYNQRMCIIEKKIKSLGGNIINIEQVKRMSCPINNEYKEAELSYKFFRVKYALEDKLKEGWAIIAMKQNWYGGNGTIDSKWMWRL